MGWESWKEAAEKGPEALVLKGCGFALLFLLPIGILLSCVGWFVWWGGNAGSLLKKELGPAALLRKYEWFKDASAALDAKLADIKVYGKRFDRLKAEYTGKKRSEWSREDREQANLWESELAGIKAAYNRLAAEFNAQHAKINWAFMDQGNVPAGGKPLPREYRAYEED